MIIFELKHWNLTFIIFTEHDGCLWSTPRSLLDSRRNFQRKNVDERSRWTDVEHPEQKFSVSSKRFQYIYHLNTGQVCWLSNGPVFKWWFENRTKKPVIWVENVWYLNNMPVVFIKLFCSQIVRFLTIQFYRVKSFMFWNRK